MLDRQVVNQLGAGGAIQPCGYRWRGHPGGGKYPLYSGLSRLHYPAADVDTRAATLKSLRYTVLSLKDSYATREAILNAISQAGEALDGENQSVIFFFLRSRVCGQRQELSGDARCRPEESG